MGLDTSFCRTLRLRCTDPGKAQDHHVPRASGKLHHPGGPYGDRAAGNDCRTLTHAPSAPSSSVTTGFGWSRGPGAFSGQDLPEVVFPGSPTTASGACTWPYDPGLRDFDIPHDPGPTDDENRGASRCTGVLRPPSSRSPHGPPTWRTTATDDGASGRERGRGGSPWESHSLFNAPTSCQRTSSWTCLGTLGADAWPRGFASCGPAKPDAGGKGSAYPRPSRPADGG